MRRAVGGGAGACWARWRVYRDLRDGLREDGGLVGLLAVEERLQPVELHRDPPAAAHLHLVGAQLARRARRERFFPRVIPPQAPRQRRAAVIHADRPQLLAPVPPHCAPPAVNSVLLERASVLGQPNACDREMGG